MARVTLHEGPSKWANGILPIMEGAGHRFTPRPPPYRAMAVTIGALRKTTAGYKEVSELCRSDRATQRVKNGLVSKVIECTSEQAQKVCCRSKGQHEGMLQI